MYPVVDHAAALASVWPPSVDRYPWGRVLTRLKRAHHAAHGSDVVIFLSREGFARFESYIDRHPSTAKGVVGATHVQLRRGLDHPIVLTVPATVGGERA